jgi:Resolvase, N terminal domain
LVTRILRPSAHPVLDRAYANTTGAVAFLEGLRSLGEQIDTSSAAGRLVLHVFGALAEFERSLMRERTMTRLAASLARGRVGGGPPALNAAQIAHVEPLAAAGTPIRDIAELLGAGRPQPVNLTAWYAGRWPLSCGRSLSPGVRLSESCCGTRRAVTGRWLRQTAAHATPK